MSDKFSALRKAINKKYGLPVIEQASTSSMLARVTRVPTGCFDFDLSLGGYYEESTDSYHVGFPVGKIVTFVGEYSSGKSAMSMRVASGFQRMCRNCGRPRVLWNESTYTGTEVECCDNPEACRICWFDAEGSWDNDWARNFGIDLDNVFVIRTHFAEQGIDIAHAVLLQGEVDLLVVDSVAALTPSVEVNESAEKWQMGTHARLMNKAMRIWQSAINERGHRSALQPSILMINQWRNKIGVMYGSPKTMPGGKGIPYMSSIIVELKGRGNTETDEGQAIELKIETACVKNKTAPPRGASSFKLGLRDHDSWLVTKGRTNYYVQLVDLAVKYGVVEKSGSWITLPDGYKAQGSDKLKHKLVSDEKCCRMLETAVLKHLFGGLTYDEETGEVLDG